MSQADELLAGYDQRVVELNAQIKARADSGEVDSQAIAALADVMTARDTLAPVTPA